MLVSTMYIIKNLSADNWGLLAILHILDVLGNVFNGFSV